MIILKQPENINEFLDLSEMANIRSKTTGLKMAIYISDKNNVNEVHGARLKVSMSYGDKIQKNNLFTVTISKNPEVIGNTGDIKSKDIEIVKKFIIDNFDELMKYWNCESDISEFLKNMKKV